MTTPEDDASGGLSTRQVRIAAVIGGVVLIVGLAVAVATAGGKPAPTPTPSTSAPAAGPPQSRPPSSPPPTSPPASVPSPTPARPVVRWRGSMTLNGGGIEKDLDSVPPRTTDERGADVSEGFAETSVSAVTDGVQIALMPSKRPPGFSQCRDAAISDGIDRVDEVGKGDVLCVLTSERRVALLRVTSGSLFGEATLRFNVTVWDPPVSGAG